MTTAAVAPGRLVAADATHRSRSVLSHRPGPARGVSVDDPRRMQDAGGSLDDLISGVWDGLSSHNAVTCPVCGGTMAPRYGSGARPVGGRCRRCGSSLG
jgi:hypothetical protein